MAATYEAALEALRQAGVHLVDVDFTAVQAYSEQHVPGMSRSH